jgi:hypothetical protein
MTFHVADRSDATPWVASSGRHVAVAWSASSGGKADVFVAMSHDGGVRFGAPVQVNAVAGEARVGGEMPPRVALITRRGRSAPDVVVLWTARVERTEIKAAKSRDGGKTFRAPMTLQSAGSAGDRGWPSVALDGRGVIHAIWLDHRQMASDRLPTTDHAAHQQHGAEHSGFAMAQKSGLYYASVADRPSPERLLTNGVCYCCKTALSADANGSLYAAWRHVYPGDLRDIAFSVSRDEGRSFSAPIRVSEDGWAINGCPDDGPAIAVDARERVHVVWPTVLGSAVPEGAIFYASSTDARHFTARVRIPTLGGPKPSHPQIVVDRAGRIIVAWDETIGGRRVAALREVKLRPNRAPAFGDIVRLSSEGATMYPVLAATDAGLLAVWTTAGDGSRVHARAIALP